ncbi:MAG: YigZ family protein [Aggregatilineales bacterium]
MNEYPIPAAPVRMLHEVNRSRLIASLSHAESVSAARQFIAAVRAEMPDASHHVYAFRVGCGNSLIEGLSDDGEPSGTAGPPIMAVLRGTGVGDVVLVVTRYFGGIKLGTGGLVRAYSEAARLAIRAMSVRQKVAPCRLAVDVPYRLYERVRLLIGQYKAHIQAEAFAESVRLELTLAERDLAAFSAALRDLSHGQVEPQRLAQPLP